MRGELFLSECGQSFRLDVDVARVRRLQQSEAAEQRRLPGSRRPDDHFHLAAVDLEGHAFQHFKIAVALMQVLGAKNDLGHQRASCEIAGTPGAATRRRRRDVQVKRRSSRDWISIKMLTITR